MVGQSLTSQQLLLCSGKVVTKFRFYRIVASVKLALSDSSDDSLLHFVDKYTSWIQQLANYSAGQSQGEVAKN